MATLLKFLRLPASDKKTLVKAAILLCAVRIGLCLLTFQSLVSLLNRTKNKKRFDSRSATTVSPEKIAGSVKLMSRYVPAATCLAQALVTVVMLEEAGLSGALRIGVAKTTTGKLEAHAWVESEGKVVIGGNQEDLSRFQILNPIANT